MRHPFAVACAAVLALLPAAAAAQPAHELSKPAEALSFLSTTNGGDFGPIRFEVLGKLDETEVRITCDAGCNVHFRERVGLSPQGAFLLATHLRAGTDDVNLVTLWQTPSRGAVIVYNISPTAARQVLREKTFNATPIFTTDDDGREQIVVPDDVDIGGGKTHADWVTVYTWNDTKFVSRRARWDDRYRAMTAAARAVAHTSGARQP